MSAPTFSTRLSFDDILCATMAGKRSTGAPPSKTGRPKNTSKVRSSAQAQPKTKVPKVRTKTQKEAQKARDAGLRDGLNDGEDSFREVLLQPVERATAVPVVVAAAVPQELAQGGDGLAGALRELEMAM